MDSDLTEATVRTAPQPTTTTRSRVSPGPGTAGGRFPPRRVRLSLLPPGGIGYATLLLVLVAYAVLVPVLSPVDIDRVHYGIGAQPPSLQHPFGTDIAGRDLFTRSAYGLRVSLLTALAGSLGAVVIGTAVGGSCAIIGGRIDRWCMRAVDAVNAVPHLLLGIVLASVFRGSLLAIIMVMIFSHWTQTARLVRSEVLAMKAEDYFRAAVSQGFSRRHLFRYHGAPRLLGHIGVAGGLLIPHTVWHESTLTFLGLGLSPHQPSLGTLIDIGQESLLSDAWWSLLMPAGLLVLVTVGIAGLLTFKDRHHALH